MIPKPYIFFPCTLLLLAVLCQGSLKSTDIDMGALVTQISALLSEMKADIEEIKGEVKSLRSDADLQRKGLDDMKKEIKEEAWLTVSRAKAQHMSMKGVMNDGKNLTGPIIKRVWCHGKDTGCCTRDNPCYVGEGDCDNDDECAGSLVCGRDNCADDGGFDRGDDCCK